MGPWRFSSQRVMSLQPSLFELMQPQNLVLLRFFCFVFCHRMENYLPFSIPFSVHVCTGCGFSFWQHLISEFPQALTPVCIALTASAPQYWRLTATQHLSNLNLSQEMVSLLWKMPCLVPVPENFSDCCLISRSHHTSQAFITVKVNGWCNCYWVTFFFFIYIFFVKSYMVYCLLL